MTTFIFLLFLIHAIFKIKTYLKKKTFNYIDKIKIITRFLKLIT